MIYIDINIEVCNVFIGLYYYNAYNRTFCWQTMLTHLGISDFERTCLICKPILSLMTRAFSNDAVRNMLTRKFHL